MAGEGGVEEETTTEYESDPEEAKLSLNMRRREASDDEEEQEELPDCRDGDDVEDRVNRDAPVIGAVDSEGESDAQGAAADYDDEEEEDEEYYDEEDYEEYEEREGGEGNREGEKAEEGGGVAKAKEAEGDGEQEGEEKGEGGEEVKKEAEPFAVPTSGAFYMHDDRFRDNAAGRHRRTFGGRKLWESKDERKWGHDKYEELNTQDRHFEEGRRSSRGHYRGRGKAGGASAGYPRGGRGRGYSGNSNQSAAPRDVRGRGPRRYQPSMKNKSDFHSPHNKQSARSFDKNSHSSSGRAAPTVSSNVEHELAPSKKVGSNLSSASPPFYPSGASSKEVPLPQKKEAQAGNNNRNMRPSTADQKFPVQLSDSAVRGKNVIDASGIDKLRIDDSVSSAGAKPVNNMHLRSSASSSLSSTQLAHPRGQGRGVAPTGSAVFQPLQATDHINKVSSPAPQANHRLPAQSQGLSPLQSPGQQLVQRPIGVSQSSSPPKAEKGAVQGNGRGSLVYGGAQVMGSGGNAGAGHGDPNIPAFFPVMQFGGQHPSGIPAVGMAFPGYVAQPNGLGNSEMTWLPVLASAAGAMGAPYCPPYLAVDGNYHPRPTGQAAALPAPSKDNNLSKPNSEVKAHQRAEVANEEFSQRQNKPRRYSEMSFSQ